MYRIAYGSPAALSPTQMGPPGGLSEHSRLTSFRGNPATPAGIDGTTGLPDSGSAMNRKLQGFEFKSGTSLSNQYLVISICYTALAYF